MTEALEKIARLASGGACDALTLPWHTLRIEHTRAIRDELAARLAPATANKHLSALRGVLAQALELGLLSAADHLAAVGVPAVHGRARRPARPIQPAEWRMLIAACERDPSPSGARDAALFALLLGVRLRRSQVVTLEVQDYDRETGRLRLPGRGSGRAPSVVVDRACRAALEAWLARRGAEPGPLFNPVNKGRRIDLRRLSEQAIYIACRKRARAAGLRPVRPEDLRSRSTPPGDRVGDPVRRGWPGESGPSDGPQLPSSGSTG